MYINKNKLSKLIRRIIIENIENQIASQYEIDGKMVSAEEAAAYLESLGGSDYEQA